MAGERASVKTATPTLINLPPPPADPVTPSDMGPGTPNSTTTSMSELSTVAIKDGHRGHLPHHHNQPLEAERADRISRLAGLGSVAAPRLTPSTAGGQASQPPHGYFDSNNQPQIVRERSTVGSASATGSVGGRTTWASGSDHYDPDKMSEDQDVDTSSMGGFSDEGAASLVGFGEGASTPGRQQSIVGSPIASKAAPLHGRDPSAMSGVNYQSETNQDARMLDGMTYDQNIVDTAARTPPPAGGSGDNRGSRGNLDA